jgi:ribosomal protein L32
VTEKQRQNPMNRLPDWRVTMPLAHACARCGARTRAGTSCRSPAMCNGRCRMHGGTSTGPVSPEGLARLAQARTLHGGYGAEMRQFRALVRELRDDARRLKAEKF